MAVRSSFPRGQNASRKENEPAAANDVPLPGKIAELDPAIVHAGGLEDRIDVSQKEIAALAESLRTAGQKVPVLVRPHPFRHGEYEIVAGRRRLAACQLAGLKVRAEIQDLDDAALVMSQAIENIAREDLTYIERAKLAVRMVDEAQLAPADIDIAFSCGKTDRSRYLKIGRGIPDDILSFIGRAPGAGRPRWEKLVSHIETDKTALGRMREMLAAANTSDDALATSDARFTLLFDAAFRKEPTPKSSGPKPSTGEEIWVSSHNKPVGTIKRIGSGVQLTLRDAPKPGFLDWLADNGQLLVDQMLREYEAQVPSENNGPVDDNMDKT